MEKNRKITECYKEIDHRIKNNLNLISSILGLQILNLDQNLEDKSIEILSKSKLRIDVISLVHDALCDSGDFTLIDFKKYLKNLVKLISKIYDHNFIVDINCEKIFFDVDIMLNLGMIISELFINSFEHSSLSDKNINKIQISLEKKSNYYKFVYHEEGDCHVDIDKIKKSDKLGMRLIQLNLMKIAGEMKVENLNGLCFTIEFGVI